MLKISVILGMCLMAVVSYAGNMDTGQRDTLFEELRRETTNNQPTRNQSSQGDIYDATLYPNSSLPYTSRNSLPDMPRVKTGDYYFFGPKIGVHGFNLQYVGFIFILALGSKDENNQNQVKMEPYPNPFQLGFRSAYYFKGQYGFIIDVEYNSFEFTQSLSNLYFKSLQYIGVNLIFSVLLKRFFSFGFGFYINFLIDSGNYSESDLSVIKKYIHGIDCGLAASIQFIIDIKIKFFIGFDFKCGFMDVRRTNYQNSQSGNNIGIFVNAGLGF